MMRRCRDKSRSERNQTRLTTNYRWQVKNEHEQRLTTWKARSRSSRTREREREGERCFGRGECVVMSRASRRKKPASRRKQRSRRMKGKEGWGEGGGGIETSHRPYTLHQSSLLARGLTTSQRGDKRTWLVGGNLGISVGTVIVGEANCGKKAVCCGAVGDRSFLSTVCQFLLLPVSISWSLISKNYLIIYVLRIKFR